MPRGSCSVVDCQSDYNAHLITASTRLVFPGSYSAMTKYDSEIEYEMFAQIASAVSCSHPDE